MLIGSLPVAGLDFSTLPQQLTDGLLLGFIYALIALGYTMVYGVLKLINFAHGEVFMFGAYAALFTSWALGYTPNHALGTGTPWMLGVMLLAAMTFCGLLGVLIERLAYRPLRTQPRIASLITAIGISLLLQYGGQIFLPLNQNIDSKINPFGGSLEIALSGSAKVDTVALDAEVKSASEKFDAYLKSSGEDAFNLKTDEGRSLRNAKQDAERKLRDAKSAGEGKTLVISYGKLIAMGTTIVLMIGLTYLVLFTKAGRAMRAVSHDFDAASLMGINVNTIVTFTFALGSCLAGAGAMMVATFYAGTKIDTFFGMVLGVKAFVAAVLGGIGNIPGAVLGGLLMGVTEGLVAWAGSTAYKDAVAFVVLILVLLLRPGGLLGSAKVEKV
ncbi:MAG: branched-chain amino acid ABC transporter permease [Fimbriimonadaceae bacterium]|nr:branched-chain amino acid ABC transporter permease [Fimbriimonadaceae bacterium]